MGIGDWGLGIGDWGLGVWGQTPYPNPQNPTPQPQHHKIKNLKKIIFLFKKIKIILLIIISFKTQKIYSGLYSKNIKILSLLKIYSYLPKNNISLIENI